LEEAPKALEEAEPRAKVNADRAGLVQAVSAGLAVLV
jgi:hypothetical protein